MEYELEEIEKKEVIKKIIDFLEKNKNKLILYLDLPEFKDNINFVYNNIKTVNYDSLEFPITNDIKTYENNNYFYYSFIQKDLYDDKQIITIIKKDLSCFYFLEADKNNNYKIINYYKDKKNNYYIKKLKDDKCEVNEKSKEIESLILKLEKTIIK